MEGNAKDTGLKDIGVLSRYDYFSGSSSENTRMVAAGFGAHTVELVMTKRTGA